MKGTIVLGYRAVYAPDVDSGKKVQKVHRMVAATFLGGPTDKTEVNHKDGNKLNNAVSNLEWVTRQENMSHAWTNGHCAGVKLTRTGTGQGVKLTREMATRLQDAYAAGASLASLARDFSISYQHASSVAKRKSWA